MAKAAMELHLAQQAGAKYAPKSSALCSQAEQALEQSRKAVARGKNEDSEVFAKRGYEYARLARVTAPGTSQTVVTLADSAP